jgi:putative transcriptional regulator
MQQNVTQRTTVVKSTLRFLIARENADRARRGIRPLTQQQIADETGIAPSVINGLVVNRAHRVDYKTIDRLCRFFDVQPGDLFEYIPEEQGDA